MLRTTLYRSIMVMIVVLAVATGWTDTVAAARLPVHIFLAEACPHCMEARPFLHELATRYPELELHEYDVWLERENFELMVALGKSVGSGAVSTPAIAIGDQVWFGFNPTIAAELEAAVRHCLSQPCPDLIQQLITPGSSPPAPDPENISPEFIVPWFGKIDADTLSLPALTIVIGLLDSFNPCAFFILLFLLSLLVHARSRKTMLLIGGIFVLCSGLIYFLFMAAWLNLFLLAGQLRLITLAAGLVALIVALINIKDYFFFRKGVTLSIPDRAKPKLFERMRGLLKQPKLASVIGGTIILAIAANSYELLCTAGFPMVFTRLLTFHQLEIEQFYLYLILYNVIYVLPLMIIVLGFTLTLGSHKLSEWHGRVLKLVSGMMMLGLGTALLVDPGWLNKISFSVGLLVVTLGAATGIILATRRRFNKS